jgi:hypothetical protein
MPRVAAAALVFGMSCLAAPEAAVSESANRVERWAAQESMQARVDTRSRAAQLLSSTDPALAARFRAKALAELPNVVATRRMVISLMALEPERGEKLLLATKDERAAYNLLANYWATRSQPLRAAALVRRAAEQVSQVWRSIPL